MFLLLQLNMCVSVCVFPNKRRKIGYHFPHCKQLSRVAHSLDCCNNQRAGRGGKQKVHWHMAHKKKISNQSYYFSFGSTCHSSHRGAQKVLMPGSQHETNRQKAAAVWQFARNENAEGKTGGGKTFASTLNLIVLRQEGQSGFCG